LPERAIPFRLEAHRGEIAPPNFIVSSLSSLALYVETAPACRLRNLLWAADRDGTVCLTGNPLLPIPGELYLSRDGLALPVGLDLVPRFSGGSLRKLLGVASRDQVVFHSDLTVTLLSEESFLPLRRSGIRMSLAQYQLGEDRL
jgi:hypothetical protein